MPACNLDNERYQSISNALIDHCERHQLSQPEIAVCLANMMLSLVATSNHESLCVDNKHGTVSASLKDKETL